MRIALINPRWTYEGSIYFGCQQPHLPLEFGYARNNLEAAGHDVLLIDAHLDDQQPAEVAALVRDFRADMAVVTTAPTYLFWRCPPPELRVPHEFLEPLRGHVRRLLAVGPHGSTTPRAVLRKLPVDGVVMGECEDVILKVANGGWDDVAGLVFEDEAGQVRVNGGPQMAASFAEAPALSWPDRWIARHHHHHHRFDAPALGPGAEVETSRGCPYSCSFCAKETHRDKYRRRKLEPVLAELDALKAQGVEYVYFIDEIFLPNRPLLEALVGRGLKFGVQTRIDLWKPDMLELLGKAGCVSIEAGVESLTVEGRDFLAKKCKLDTDELAALLIEARRHVPFVQANLLEMAGDAEALVADWRDRLRAAGVWANDPVPLFPYPGSPDFRRQLGALDDQAWERALDYYLTTFATMSDLQDARPLRLCELETRLAA